MTVSMLVRAALISTAVGLTLSAEAVTPMSRAAARCDETCQMLKKILDGQSTNFESLRGKHYTAPGFERTWLGTIKPLNMYCTTGVDYTDHSPSPNYDYMCSNPITIALSKTEAEPKFRVILAAFRQATPDWRWFREERDGSSSTEIHLHGELTTGADNATLFMHCTDGCNLDFVIHAKPQKPLWNLKPYQQN